jgi:hypothetical protein
MCSESQFVGARATLSQPHVRRAFFHHTATSRCSQTAPASTRHPACILPCHSSKQLHVTMAPVSATSSPWCYSMSTHLLRVATFTCRVAILIAALCIPVYLFFTLSSYVMRQKHDAKWRLSTSFPKVPFFTILVMHRRQRKPGHGFTSANPGHGPCYVFAHPDFFLSKFN